MKSYDIPLYPGNSLTIILYQNVSNTDEIMSKLLKGELEYSIINCKAIFDHRQLLFAATKVLSIQHSSKLSTHNVHSELIYLLSPTTNMKDSIKKFGLQADDKQFYIAIFNSTSEKLNDIKSLVKGDQVEEQYNEQSKTIENTSYFSRDTAIENYSLKEYKDIAQCDDSKLKSYIFNSMSMKGLLK
ncbi:hypothetical protein DLAC_02760 [Tieghemostelium lacteum]|uniref:EKC/KEOPS complex subunit cgi121 n=1 Tax=Tieghemostelium lacteum TaxID=361077 RepID=A0A152A3D3_TIELA|nr:hypothetical protein DLAC_02760 [Tieghemostelium lacteum]|eukprot:KYR00720.1 hypothetical protein DLAC_02760 [Tieghemostelium lacteum]